MLYETHRPGHDRVFIKGSFKIRIPQLSTLGMYSLYIGPQLRHLLVDETGVDEVHRYLERIGPSLFD